MVSILTLTQLLHCGETLTVSAVQSLALPHPALSPTNRSPILLPALSLPPPVTGEQRRPVPQDANQPLCPAHAGEHSQRPEGSLDQWPPLPGRLLPLAVRAHLGVVADEQNGQEENTKLQEWRGKFIPISSPYLRFFTLLTASLAAGMLGLQFWIHFFSSSSHS